MKEKFIKVAENEVGYREGKNNDTKYGVWFGMNNQPWCMMFIDWCANQIGVLDTLIPRTASCPTAYKWFKKKGLISSTPKSGDIGFYQKKNKKGVMNQEHAFIVKSVSGNTITTIEGNLNNAVVKNTRKLSKSLVFGHVEWKDDTDYFVSGNYRLLYNKAIRKTPAISNNIVKVKDCDNATKKCLTSKIGIADAYLKKDTEIKCREIYKENSGRIFGSYGNCWVCLCNKDGTRQAEKI